MPRVRSTARRLVLLSVLLVGCGHGSPRESRPPAAGAQPIPSPTSTPAPAWEPPRPQGSPPQAPQPPQHGEPIVSYAMWDAGETVLVTIMPDRHALVWRGTVDNPPFQGTMLLPPDRFNQISMAGQAIVAAPPPLPPPTPTPAPAGPIVDGPTQQIIIHGVTPMVLTLGVGGVAEADLPPALQQFVQDLGRLRHDIDRAIPPLNPPMLTYTYATLTETRSLEIDADGQVAYHGLRGKVLPPAQIQRLTSMLHTVFVARHPDSLPTEGMTLHDPEVSLWWYEGAQTYSVRAAGGAGVSADLHILLQELATIYATARP